MAADAQDTFAESAVTLRFGIVIALDETLGRVRLRLPDLDDLVTWWLPVIMSKTHKDRHWHLPDIGEHVAALLDARGETGVVLGAITGERDRPAAATVHRHTVIYEDGTQIDYDRAAHRLTVQCVGDIMIESATHITLKAPRIDLNP